MYGEQRSMFGFPYKYLCSWTDFYIVQVYPGIRIAIPYGGMPGLLAFNHAVVYVQNRPKGEKSALFHRVAHALGEDDPVVVVKLHLF